MSEEIKLNRFQFFKRASQSCDKFINAFQRKVELVVLNDYLKTVEDSYYEFNMINNEYQLKIRQEGKTEEEEEKVNNLTLDQALTAQYENVRLNYNTAKLEARPDRSIASSRSRCSSSSTRTSKSAKLDPNQLYNLVESTAVQPIEAIVPQLPSKLATVQQKNQERDLGDWPPLNVRTQVPLNATANSYIPPPRDAFFNPAGSFQSNIQLEKMKLPEFHGVSKDYPEFCCLFRTLAEDNIQHPLLLAHNLKLSLKGKSKEVVDHISVTKPGAYDLMWKRLEDAFNNKTVNAQNILLGLNKLKPVKEEDYKSIVRLIDAIQSAYSQLESLDLINSITVVEVDRLNNLLPASLRQQWIYESNCLPADLQLRPFFYFMTFLERQRDVFSRFAATTQHESSRINSSTHTCDKKINYSNSSKKYSESKSEYNNKGLNCVMPNHLNVKSHNTEDCVLFKKLNLNERYQALKKAGVCYRCFKNHKIANCFVKTFCTFCKENSHKTLMCRKVNSDDQNDSEKVIDKSKDNSPVQVSSNSCVSTNVNFSRTSLALYPIQYAVTTQGKGLVSLFCDNGSDSSYITHEAAKRLNAKKLNNYVLDVTTVGNKKSTYDTFLYEISVKTQANRCVKISAFGLETISGPVSMLDAKVIYQLFPDFDPNALQRKKQNIDVLLGVDHFALHPKQELATAGQNLSVMMGELGICLIGTHPSLQEETKVDCNLVKTLHDACVSAQTHKIQMVHAEFNRPQSKNNLYYSRIKIDTKENCQKMFSGYTKIQTGTIENYIKGNELSLEVNPRCGSCKCSKCPSPGHQYSFKEEQELKLIQNNLKYDSDNERWVTSYPWIEDPSVLKNNYKIAVATLKSTEKRLLKDKKWGDIYSQQIQDMLDRGVAKKLTKNELSEWQGPFYYISHLAVINQNSQSTPVRIVFNASQNCNGMSLNSILAKGPDNYLNNLLGLLLRWRENKIVIIGDIKKMFNSIYFEPLEQQCHRFLWRDLDVTKEPEVYMMTRVNFGDKPAPAICSEALYKTCELFKNEYPKAASLIRYSTYVDDIVDSVSSKQEALLAAREVECMLTKAGFKIKCWQFSGESEQRPGGELDEHCVPKHKIVSLLKSDGEMNRVLGISWCPNADKILYKVSLNFSPKKKGIRTEADLAENQVPNNIPTILTRRLILEQVMGLWDPLGILSAFTLLFKIYLRETWALKLTWDQPLPPELHKKWVHLFTVMFELNQIKYERVLRPVDAVGEPSLIIFSDGSEVAYAFAAYIRWQLENGNFWCRLIMSKSRIAPLNRISIPQMELNGALLSKRGRKVIESEMRFKFKEVLQIVDSQTVLCMLNRVSTRFKVYEGVRIGEIQAATNGDMTCWGWLPACHNIADWATRGKYPKMIDGNSEWYNGPAILYEPIDKWGLKFGAQHDEALDSEKKYVFTTTSEGTLTDLFDYNKFSDIKIIIWVVARLINIFRCKSISGGKVTLITPSILKEAEMKILKRTQKTMLSELKKVNRKGALGGRYCRINPVQNTSGLWIIGKRLQNYNPMTFDADPQILLPTKNIVTKLFMKRAHVESGHRSRDGTLAHFRLKYWTPHGSKVAGSVKESCQLCKLRDAKFLKQSMGILPAERLRPSPAFQNTMLDLFGPYLIRGETQKRTTSKCYFVIFTDMVMRAIHIEVSCGYDTNSFLLALSRFVSIRGYPHKIYSDRGSQLWSASEELKKAWDQIDRASLVRAGTDHGLTWVFGPADSPWHQGAVESLVKVAKRAIDFSIHDQRLSLAEILTVGYEAANLVNERPLGIMPSLDSSINLLTPNSLLIGRCTATNPGGWQPTGHKLLNRYYFVQNIVDVFWKKWIELCSPALHVQQKWFTSHRNLKVGDVVMIADSNALRGDYRIGLVKEIHAGCDGQVRSATLIYKNFKIGEKVFEYKGSNYTTVTRGIQKLALLVPVE